MKGASQLQLDRIPHILNLDKMKNNIINKPLLQTSVDSLAPSTMKIPFQKVQSITPQNLGGVAKMFESSNKGKVIPFTRDNSLNLNPNQQLLIHLIKEDTNGQNAAFSVNKNQKLSSRKCGRTQTNKPKPLDIESNELEESSSYGCQEISSLMFEEASKQAQEAPAKQSNSILQELDKMKPNQKEIEKQSISSSLMFDKLKKRKNKTSCSAKNHEVSKLNNKCSFTKSPQPSNSSTNTQQAASKGTTTSTTAKGATGSRGTPQSQGGGVRATGQFFSSPNNQAGAFKTGNQVNNLGKGIVPNNVNSNHNHNKQQQQQQQLSKTMSFTLQQYHSLMNQDQSTSWQENIAKLMHSNSAAMHSPPSNNQNGLVNNQNEGKIGTSSKHRKIASMNSSSPKYSKENMYIDFQKGDYNITSEFMKLINQQNSTFSAASTKSKKKISDFHHIYSPPAQLQNNQDYNINLNSSGGGGVGGGTFQGMKVKFSNPIGAKNALFNQSANISMNQQGISRLEEQEESENNVKHQEKNNKSFLSKISNNIEYEIKQKKQMQKKNSKSQGTAILISPSSYSQTHQSQKKNISAILENQNNNQSQQEEAIKGTSNKGNIQNPINTQIHGDSTQVAAPPFMSQQNCKLLEEVIPLQQLKEEKIKQKENNKKVSSMFDNLLKQRIDENSYQGIMEVFNQLIQNDTHFKPSLQKFKICIDSLLHDMNIRIQDLKEETTTLQALKGTFKGGINHEITEKMNNNFLQNENPNQQLSNSTDNTNSNPSKTYHESSHKKKFQNQVIQKNNEMQNVIKCSDKQTQTTQLIKGSKDHIEQLLNDNDILKNYVMEQEKKMTAYKTKETSMIKLLLAIKKRGINIDDIYDKDVITLENNLKMQKSQNNDQEDDGGDEEDEEEIIEQEVRGNSKYLENIIDGNLSRKQDSQSIGFADDSIINDSDESSFNYFGKTQNEVDLSMMSADSNSHRNKINSNVNSGRSKLEEQIQKKLRINLEDLNKISTQQTEEAGPNIEQQEQLLEGQLLKKEFSKKGKGQNPSQDSEVENDFFLKGQQQQQQQQLSKDKNNIVNKFQLHNEMNDIQDHCLDASSDHCYQQNSKNNFLKEEQLFHKKSNLPQKELGEHIQKRDQEAFKNNNQKSEYGQVDDQNNQVFLEQDHLI